MEINLRNTDNRIKNFRELKVYSQAFDAAMQIFTITKKFPSEERYSMTDQIRRSSRSICANLSEAWRKRNYVAVFKNKITDCTQEAAETQTWLQFAYYCGYINADEFSDLDQKYNHIFAMLHKMDQKAQDFCKC